MSIILQRREFKPMKKISLDISVKMLNRTQQIKKKLLKEKGTSVITILASFSTGGRFSFVGLKSYYLEMNPLGY